jgi:hypothetical protein
VVKKCNSQTIFDSAVVLFGPVQHGEYAAHDLAAIFSDVCHESVAAVYYGETKSAISD